MVGERGSTSARIVLCRLRLVACRFVESRGERGDDCLNFSGVIGGTAQDVASDRRREKYCCDGRGIGIVQRGIQIVRADLRRMPLPIDLPIAADWLA